MVGITDERSILRAEVDQIAEIHHAAATTIGLGLSHSCPVRCAHCAVDCLPDLSEPASENDLTSWLEQVAANGNYQTVNITGGEPLDHPDALLHVLRVCALLGLKSTMVTSGVWATSHSNATRVLRPLTDAGLSAIFVSFDEYHLRRVPVTRVAAALQVAHDNGTVIGISTLVGPGLRDLEDLLGCLTPHLTTQARADLHILSNTMVFSGRAARLRRRHHRPGQPLISLRCSGTGLVIHESGAVYGCCGPDQPEDSALHLGDLHTRTFQDIYSTYRGSLLPAMIRLVGVRSLIDCAVASGVTDMACWSQAPDGEACNMCQSLTSSQHALDAVLNDAGLRRQTAERALLLERDPGPLLREQSKSRVSA